MLSLPCILRSAERTSPRHVSIHRTRVAIEIGTMGISDVPQILFCSYCCVVGWVQLYRCWCVWVKGIVSDYDLRVTLLELQHIHGELWVYVPSLLWASKYDAERRRASELTWILVTLNIRSCLEQLRHQWMMHTVMSALLQLGWRSEPSPIGKRTPGYLCYILHHRDCVI